MNEVAELIGIAYKEDGGVVADHIPVSVFGVKFDCETAHVAFSVCGAALTCDRREAQQAVGLFTYFREYPGPGIARDIISHGECAVSPRTFGMHDPLRYAFAVESSHLLQELIVLHQKWTAGAGSQ